MERVIVTVKRYQEARVRDLEIPAGLEAGRLAEVIASALHWDTDSAGRGVHYKIEVHPPGRVLGLNETLNTAGVGDGAWLTFIPESGGSRDSSSSSKEPKKPSGPVGGWKPLFPDQPSGKTSSPANQPDSGQPSNSPFTWKEVDDQ